MDVLSCGGACLCVVSVVVQWRGCYLRCVSVVSPAVAAGACLRVYHKRPLQLSSVWEVGCMWTCDAACLLAFLKSW